MLLKSAANYTTSIWPPQLPFVSRLRSSLTDALHYQPTGWLVKEQGGPANVVLVRLAETRDGSMQPFHNKFDHGLRG